MFRPRYRFFVLFFVGVILLSLACQSSWQASQGATRTPAAVLIIKTAHPSEPSATMTLEGQVVFQMTATITAQAMQTSAAKENPPAEPAGCLSAEAQSRLATPAQMLAYADSLLLEGMPLEERRLEMARNEYSGENTLRGSRGDVYHVMELDISGVRDEGTLQRMLNALQVSGFVTWLRRPANQTAHILAIPLLDSQIMQSAWQPYVEAYWRSRDALPEKDSSVVSFLKLPACDWMVAQGFSPQRTAEWWPAKNQRIPQYAEVAQTFVALDTEQSIHSAQRVGWMNSKDADPSNMCGPLVWELMEEAGAFPPERGNWSVGGKSFWLANPRSSDGRPWSLFSKALFRLSHFSEPMGTFDFGNFPLYPGDFIFSYSRLDGFYHMFLVTEQDAQGNRYSVTNLTFSKPVKKTTIERVILYNPQDSGVGIIRNQWNLDHINGRTGDDGFDVFRWAWMQKNVSGQAAAYTVATGDNFQLIAERWKTPADQIAGYNGKKVEDVLRVGETLQIPPLPLSEK